MGSIQWFPGHMTKARRMISEQSAFVDVICEIIDARIPRSSRNPDLAKLTGNKPQIIVLNRSDLADPSVTSMWKSHLSQFAEIIICDSKSGAGVSEFSAAVEKTIKGKLERRAERGVAGMTVRAMVAGIPNAGKSTFINRLAKRKAAIAADKPGVTRGRQWISISKSLELLDTPGILWPKIESEQQGDNLAFTGAVNDDIIDSEELAAKLCELLKLQYPLLLSNRYKLDSLDLSGAELITECAKSRGYKARGGVPDVLRMSKILLDEFRSGAIGRITLEKPE